MTSIEKQLKRLEDVVGSVHGGCVNHLGETHAVTKQALKSVAYLEGLKFDVLKMESENKWK